MLLQIQAVGHVFFLSKAHLLANGDFCLQLDPVFVFFTVVCARDFMCGERSRLSEVQTEPGPEAPLS